MEVKKLNKNFYLNFSLILFIFLIDRISKLYVIHQDKLNSNFEIYSSKFLNIHLIWNEGIAFGLFSFNEDYLYNEDYRNNNEIKICSCEKRNRFYYF